MTLTLSPRHPVTPPLNFPDRARCETTHTAERRIFTSGCGRYRVVEARSFFIRGRRRERQVTITAEVSTWVEHIRKHCWAPISKHQSINKAFEACQKAADENSA